MFNSKLQTNGYKIASSSPDVLNLAIVENFTSSSQDFNLYPRHHRMEELKNHIRKYINHHDIMVTNGSGAGLDIILQVFMGSKILIPVPNYPGFIHSAKFYCEPIMFDFDGKDILQLEKHIPDCDIIYVSVPNLPLSYIIDMRTLCKKYSDKIFIIDEAYGEYVDGYESHISLIHQNPNVIVTKTFSKAFALAGARIGYVAANAKLINKFETLNISKNVLDLSIKLAIDAMLNKEKFIKKARETIEMKKEYESKIPITPFSQVYEVISGQTPWLLLKVRNPKAVCASFLEHGILIRDKSDDICDAVRISMCDKKTMDKILRLLSTYSTIVFDLDGTLRETTSSPLYDVETIKKIPNDIKILTDNTAPFTKIYEAVKELVSKEDLICPDLKEKSWYVEDNKLYILKFDCSYELLLKAQTHDIYVVEDNYSEQSSEHGLNPNIELPHIGCLLKFIGRPYTIIGKSKKLIELPRPALVIGDSINDELFAKNNNYSFYKVDSVKKLHELLKSTAL